MTAEMPSINDLADTPIERDYSLILTVYQKSKVKDFSRSLSSMLNQTIPPKEIIVVEDGPISIELAEYVERQANTTNISVLKLKNNVGPALAAQAGIDIAKCALIARLDTDDEALPNRMERELQFLSENPEYDSVGSLVQEISLDGNISSAVNLPESFEEIREYSRKRCPCRQTTLLYRKTALQSVGGYNNLRVAEEWDLYNRLIEAGCKCHNIQEVLVKMYVDDNYYARRGGITTLSRLAQFKTDMLKAGRMSISDYIPSMAASIISCLLPNRIRTFVYVKLLRDYAGFSMDNAVEKIKEYGPRVVDDVFSGKRFLNSRSDAVLYNSALVILIFAHVLDSSTAVELSYIDLLATGLKWTAVVLLGIRVFVNFIKGDIRIDRDAVPLTVAIIFMILSLVTFFFSGEKNLFMMSVLILGSYGRPLHEMLHIALISIACSVLLIAAMAIIGLIDFNVVAGDLTDSGDRIQRYAFGFNHPNALGMMFIVELLVFAMYANNRIRVSHVVSIIVAIAFLLLVVKTRTAALILAFGLVLLLVARIWTEACQGSQKKLAILITGLTVIFAASGIGLVVLYGMYPDQLAGLDDILSRRLSYAVQFLDNYPITLFGQHVNLMGTIDAFIHNTEPLVLDNAYFHSLICQGLIPFLFTMYVYLYCILRKDRLVGIGVRVAVCLSALVGISETLPITFLGVFPLVSMLMTTQRDEASGVISQGKQGDK